jgi:hypothetical protein
MKKIFVFVFLLVSAIGSAQSNRATGLSFDDDKYLNTKRLSTSLKFTSAELPIAFSLKNYCPKPGNQGQIGSCVGWATGYAALTIAKAIQDNNTSTESITRNARSARFIYDQIVDQCPNGSVINDAFNLVQTQGDCLFTEFEPSTCKQIPGSNIKALASSFKIKDFYKLFESSASADQKINETKNSLNAKKPVVIGMMVSESFNRVGPSGEWNPPSNDYNIGGHALCVIGYDDARQRFEIINSWGTDWGNRGFFTISYADYGKLCKYGFQFTLNSPVVGPVSSLSGNFQFKKYSGYNSSTQKPEFTEVTPKLNGTTYTLSSTVRVNDFFRISASNIPKDKYVYIISLKPDGSTDMLFPTSSIVYGVSVKDIPVVPYSNVVLEIPADEKKGLTTDQAGDDVLCILFSSKSIDDIDNVLKNIKRATGSFESRLRSALGDKLIPYSDITYSNNVMGVSSRTTSTGTIAPIILKVSVIN